MGAPSPSRAGPLLLCLLLAGSVVGAAPGLLAQEDPDVWRIGAGASERAVEVDRSQGYSAVPVSALVAVGVEIRSAAGDVVVRIGEREVRFTPGSPYFTAGRTVYQLVHPVYLRGGVTYLPVQFLVDQLPLLAGPMLVLDWDDRHLYRTDAPPGPAGPPSPEPAPARAGQAALPPLVVLDAGHGGVDPGAIGPGGTREKDVTLAVARRLQAILEADGRFRVRMTRDRDSLVALRDRPEMANRWREDGQPALFMSIHANASERRGARGFETYFLSEALSEDARRVARMENAAQRFESSHDGEGDRDPLSFILHDLLQNRYLHESAGWAGMIQNRVAEVHPGPDRGVKQAGFVVLNGAFMPAVLVELGFITNPDEERMLADPATQGRLARGLAASVRDYFQASGAVPVADR